MNLIVELIQNILYFSAYLLAVGLLTVCLSMPANQSGHYSNAGE